MSTINISLTERGHVGDISEIRIDGVIDTMTAGELEEVIESLLKRNRYRLVVDMAGVDYISSAGWGIFISHIKVIRSHHGDLKLANMVSDVREVFELLEFDNVLQSFTSVEAALTSFGPADQEEPKKKEPKTHG